MPSNVRSVEILWTRRSAFMGRRARERERKARFYWNWILVIKDNIETERKSFPKYRYIYVFILKSVKVKFLEAKTVTFLYSFCILSRRVIQDNSCESSILIILRIFQDFERKKNPTEKTMEGVVLLYFCVILSYSWNWNWKCLKCGVWSMTNE